MANLDQYVAPQGVTATSAFLLTKLYGYKIQDFGYSRSRFDMRKFVARSSQAIPPNLQLARVLVVHGDLAPRLALQTILQAGGYAVDAAATPGEALAKLDESRYDLVLSEAELKPGEQHAGRNVLAYARVKEYRPATAVITSAPQATSKSDSQQFSVYAENLPLLLGKVAELIGLRASRRYRPLRQAV
jgi:CheY-like chemotaxis protein